VLLMQRLYNIADPAWGAEVVGGTGRGFAATEQSQVVVGGGVALSRDLDDMIKGGARAFAGQIEIGVLSEVERRGAIRGGGHFDDQV